MKVTKPGTLLAGRYRIERLLGEGATGVVWLARDMRARGHVWAIKELDFSGIPEEEREEVRALFERESTILTRLQHAGLPQVADRFSEGGCEYLVMERVDGPTLDQVMEHRNNHLTEEEVVDWALQICSALHYLHHLTPPVIYRDLKPANVMLTRQGVIKLIDFGIARPLNPHRPGDTVAYGTPGYAPPEQYMGLASPRSDLYALGACMYELLTRRDLKAAGFQFDSVRSYHPRVSEDLDRLIMQCLRTDPAERPATAADVEVRLRAVASKKPRRWWQILRR